MTSPQYPQHAPTPRDEPPAAPNTLPDPIRSRLLLGVGGYEGSMPAVADYLPDCVQFARREPYLVARKPHGL